MKHLLELEPSALMAQLDVKGETQCPEVGAAEKPAGGVARAGELRQAGVALYGWPSVACC